MVIVFHARLIEMTDEATADRVRWRTSVMVNARAVRGSKVWDEMMSNAQRPTPNVQRPTPNVQCPTHNIRSLMTIAKRNFHHSPRTNTTESDGFDDDVAASTLQISLIYGPIFAVLVG